MMLVGSAVCRTGHLRRSAARLPYTLATYDTPATQATHAAAQHTEMALRCQLERYLAWQQQARLGTTVTPMCVQGEDV